MISFDHLTSNPIPESHKNKNKNKRSMEDLNITNSSHHHQSEEQYDQIMMINYHSYSSKPKTMKWAFHTDLHLHLQSPSPQDHQQCHFKFGKKYCYDQKTPMNLDLELNLPCGTSMSSSVGKQMISSLSSDQNQKETADQVVAAAEGEDDQTEMVAAACRRCHMLVMMCKASPACPNCKFVHPPELSQPGLFIKPRRTTYLNSLLV